MKANWYIKKTLWTLWSLGAGALWGVFVLPSPNLPSGVKDKWAEIFSIVFGLLAVIIVGGGLLYVGLKCFWDEEYGETALDSRDSGPGFMFWGALVLSYVLTGVILK